MSSVDAAYEGGRRWLRVKSEARDRSRKALSCKSEEQEGEEGREG